MYATKVSVRRPQSAASPAWHKAPVGMTTSPLSRPMQHAMQQPIVPPPAESGGIAAIRERQALAKEKEAAEAEARRPMTATPTRIRPSFGILSRSHTTAAPSTAAVHTAITSPGRAPGYARIGDYEMLDKVYSAAEGVVYRAQHLHSGRVVALKQRFSSELGKFGNVWHEVDVLRGLRTRSEYLIEVIDAFEQPRGTLNAVFEWAAGADLASALDGWERGGAGRAPGRTGEGRAGEGRTGEGKTGEGRGRSGRHIPEHVIWSILAQLFQAIACLHENGIIHRDVKSANVLLFEDAQSMLCGQAPVVTRLCDLGVAAAVNPRDPMHSANELYGTPLYLAPEVAAIQYGGSSYGRSYGPAIDIWSAGVVAYELAALMPPFDGETILHITDAITAASYEEIPYHYTEDLAALIDACLQVEPSRRIDAATAASTCLAFAAAAQPASSQEAVSHFTDEPVRSEAMAKSGAEPVTVAAIRRLAESPMAKSSSDQVRVAAVRRLPEPPVVVHPHPHMTQHVDVAGAMPTGSAKQLIELGTGRDLSGKLVSREIARQRISARDMDLTMPAREGTVASRGTHRAGSSWEQPVKPSIPPSTATLPPMDGEEKGSVRQWMRRLAVGPSRSPAPAQSSATPSAEAVASTALSIDTLESPDARKLAVKLRRQATLVSNLERLCADAVKAAGHSWEDVLIELAEPDGVEYLSEQYPALHAHAEYLTKYVSARQELEMLQHG